MSSPTTDAPTITTITEQLARARSDYLAVSRGRGMYDTTQQWQEAEDRAWRRMEEALSALATLSDADQSLVHERLGATVIEDSPAAMDEADVIDEDVTDDDPEAAPA